MKKKHRYNSLTTDTKQSDFIPRDENILERARTQWLFGDWESLIQLERNIIQTHPDRAKLALLAASGYIQQGDIETARQYIRLAKDWGCNKKFISQVLIAGVYNTLGRAAATTGDNQQAIEHFEGAVKLVAPRTDASLWGHARSVRETIALGLLPQASILIENLQQQSKQGKLHYTREDNHTKVLDIEVNWLRERIHLLQKQYDRSEINPIIGNVKESPLSETSSQNKSKKYYGLHNLDQKLEAYIDYNNGYFVELGANDGITQSNTYYFEKERGWHGLLIEPILHNFLKCKVNRSEKNTFACAACVSFEYDKEYVDLIYSNLMTTPTELETDIPDPIAHAESGTVHLKNHETPVKMLAPAKTLNNLLDEAQAPRLIDLLSLDVEGAEIEVLKGIDHDKYRFKYLLIECRDERAMDDYLKKKGYHLLDKLSHHDYLYVDNGHKI